MQRNKETQSYHSIMSLLSLISILVKLIQIINRHLLLPIDSNYLMKFFLFSFNILRVNSTVVVKTLLDSIRHQFIYVFFVCEN